jgi:hypothetical protein
MTVAVDDSVVGSWPDQRDATADAELRAWRRRKNENK